jgi:site-specific DNA-methyltransferase (adenine-specific)
MVGSLGGGHPGQYGHNNGRPKLLDRKVIVIDVEEVKVDRDRMRKDSGNIRELAESLALNGQIQPITMENGHLRTGWRRWVATGLLKTEGKSIGCMKPEGHPARLEPGKILAIPLEELTRIERLQLELAENRDRKQLTDAEEAIGMMKLKEAIEEIKGRKIGQRELARELGLSTAYVSMGLTVAKAVNEGDRELLRASSVRAAYRQYKNEEKLRQLKERALALNPEAASDLQAKMRLGNALDLIKEVEDESVGLIHFDPPWGIGIDDYDRRQRFEAWDDSPATWDSLIRPIVPELWRVAANDSYIIMWCGAQYFNQSVSLLESVGYIPYATPYVWYKNNKKGAQNDPTRFDLPVTEFFILARKGEPRFYKMGGTNVLVYPMPTQRIHYAQKNVDMLVDLLERWTFGNMLVLDPTFGSGAALMAAKRLGRPFLGFEKSKKNHESAISWLLTGGQDGD